MTNKEITQIILSHDPELPPLRSGWHRGYVKCDREHVMAVAPAMQMKLGAPEFAARAIAALLINGDLGCLKSDLVGWAWDGDPDEGPQVERELAMIPVLLETEGCGPERIRLTERAHTRCYNDLVAFMGLICDVAEDLAVTDHVLTQ